MSRKGDHPALVDLRGILSVIDSAERKGKGPDLKLLSSVKDMTLSAIQILTRPDPKTERLSLVVLMLRESTKVEEREIRGKITYKVSITDQIGYSWAMGQIHNMAEVLRRL